MSADIPKEGAVSETAAVAAVATTAAAADEWPTDPTLYQLVVKIGQGAFATVWKATRSIPIPEGEEEPQQVTEESSTTTTVCAVKVLNLDHVDTNLAEIRLEVQAMRLLSHPNVLTIHTAFVKDRNLWLVTPLMNKGSALHCLQGARRALRKQQPTQVTKMEDHIMYIMHETLLGLQYIHENGQIHRDIKAGNILLDGNGNVQIADFGVSGFLVHAGSQLEKASTFVGTPAWMSPELMEQVHGYDYKADVWSLGITALELAKGYAPYAKYPPMKVLILTIQEDPPSLASYDVENVDYDDDEDDDHAEEYSKQFENFVASCLQKDPTRRPTCPELLASKHFAAFQKDDFRTTRQEALRTEICSLVKDVGYKHEQQQQQQQEASPRLPGNVPVSIVLSQAEDRPAGTTWVFADGSQVVSSSQAPAEMDDVMADLDDFERQTGGEDYDRKTSNKSSDKQQQKVNESKDDSQNVDELDQFMDEFELNTGGEDFRRNDPNT